MKKALCGILIITILSLLCLGACSEREKSGVAFICSASGVEERFEGQALKTAIYNYCTEQNLPYYEYVSDGSAEFYAEAAAAASRICDIAVCDSEASAALAPNGSAYEISFLFMNYGGKAPSNGRCVSISEEDAAFLAGYAAVRDGNERIAFLGGEDNEINRRYMNGFLQGVSAAAGYRIIQFTYCFTGSDEATDDAKAIAQSMLINDADILFVCGADIYKSAVQAANITKKFLIGGEMDQAGESERFVTSATKKYGDIIPAELGVFFAEKQWSGNFSGSAALYRYANGGVCIPEYNGAFRFTQFTHDDLEAVKELLASGSLTVERGTDIPQLPETISVNEFSQPS